MKIKFYNALIVAAAFSMTTTSCSDFLDEDNKTGETAELTYNTSAGLNGLAGTCYSFARGWYGKEAGLGLSEMGTDLFYYGYDNKQKSLLQYNINSKSLDSNTSDNACLDHYWEMFYCAVDACNNLLKYAPTNNNITESSRAQYLAEGHFLRAFYYFHMVNIWGPVTYISEPPTSINLAPTRMPEEQLYGKILEDLDQSLVYFEQANIKTKASSQGRAYYWSAKALKARVLLYAASWLGETSLTSSEAYAGKNLYQLAQAEAQDVIDNSGASFYANYEDTWSMNNEAFEDNDEALFGITYSPDLKTTVNCIPKRYKTNASQSAMDYSSLITRTGYSRGGSAMLLMFVSKWNNGCKDLGGNGTGNSCVFYRATATSTIKSALTGNNVAIAEHYSPYGRGFTRYLPSLYLFETLEKYRATDQRTDATLLTAYTIASPELAGNAKNYPLLADTAIYYSPLDGNSAEGQALQAWAKNRYRVQFAYNGDIPVYSSGDVAKAVPTEAAKAVSDVYNDNRYNDYNIGGWTSYPGIKKFLDNVYDSNYPTHDISGRDAIVLRLAEMYLIKAECQLKTEGGDAAMTTINQLRQERAIVVDGVKADNKLTGSANIETVLEERAIELCGEQQRWFDLKRTHTLGEHVAKYNAQSSGNFKENVHYYRPIPDTQLETISNFTNEANSETGFWQNPGY